MRYKFTEAIDKEIGRNGYHKSFINWLLMYSIFYNFEYKQSILLILT
jgi:hypothetical protein